MPCFGFDTTGTTYDDRGVSAALIALLKRFAEPSPPVPNTVGIVGATPLDFADGTDIRDLQDALLERGIEVTATLAMGYDLEALRRAATAHVNLAVSRAGFLVSKWMHRRFGTPYLCGLPMGAASLEAYFRALGTMLKAELPEPRILKGESPSRPLSEHPKVLVIGEQVQANAIRCALEMDAPPVRDAVSLRAADGCGLPRGVFPSAWNHVEGRASRAPDTEG